MVLWFLIVSNVLAYVSLFFPYRSLPVPFVQRHLPKQHVAELLSVCAFAIEIRQHVPEVAVEIRRPLSVEVPSEVFAESFREKPGSESFTRMVVVMPPCDVKHRLVIYPFHVVCILSGAARQGACLFSCCMVQPSRRTVRQGLTWKNTAAERG